MMLPVFFVLFIFLTKKSFNRIYKPVGIQTNFYCISDASAHSEKETTSHSKFIRHFVKQRSSLANSKYFLFFVSSLRELVCSLQEGFYNYPGILNLGLFFPGYIVRANCLTVFFAALSDNLLQQIDNLRSIRGFFLFFIHIWRQKILQCLRQAFLFVSFFFLQRSTFTRI